MNPYNARKQNMQQLIQQFVTLSDEAGRQRIASALLRVTPGLAGFSNSAAGTGANNPSEEAAPQGGNPKQDPQDNMANQALKDLEAYREELLKALMAELEEVRRQLDLAQNSELSSLIEQDEKKALINNLEPRSNELDAKIRLFS